MHVFSKGLCNHVLSYLKLIPDKPQSGELKQH